MFKIKSVSIDGVWGRRKLKTKIYDDINIFIGKNGTGKTTFIDILIAVLTVDFGLLKSVRFKRVELVLESDAGRIRSKKIIVEKSDDKPTGDITYSIAGKKIKIPVFYLEDDRNDAYEFYVRRNKPESVAIKKELSEIISVSSLSVHRIGLYDFDSSQTDGHEYFIRERDREEKTNPIDLTLNHLIGKLKDYQLRLNGNAKDVYTKLQGDILKSLLFDEHIDSIDSLENVREKFDLEAEKSRLVAVYRDLGVYQDEKELIKNMNKHFNALEKGIDSFKQNSKWDVNTVLRLPLIERTKKIANLSADAQIERRIIFSALNLYLEEIQNYFYDKKIDVDNDGKLRFYKDDIEIPLMQLSSGEKQILILLTETLLQQGESRLFIADEPEISLHIEWQAKILSSVIKLNKNAQIIVATHSPEIAGKYLQSVLNMEDILVG